MSLVISKFVFYLETITMGSLPDVWDLPTPDDRTANCQSGIHVTFRHYVDGQLHIHHPIQIAIYLDRLCEYQALTAVPYGTA